MFTERDPREEVGLREPRNSETMEHLSDCFLGSFAVNDVLDLVLTLGPSLQPTQEAAQCRFRLTSFSPLHGVREMEGAKQRPQRKCL